MGQNKKVFSSADVLTTDFMNQFVQETQIKSALSTETEPEGYKEIPSLKLVSDKFASVLREDGVTARKAFDAVISENVTKWINGIRLSDIFDTDGKTALKAVSAKYDENNNAIVAMYRKVSDQVSASSISIRTVPEFGNAATLQGALDYIASVLRGDTVIAKISARIFNAE